MNKEIDIPEEFSDLIESCENMRSGQTRKYGPYEKVFVVMLKNDYDDKDRERILEFCQKYCHKCKYSDKELLAIKRNSELSFNELMLAVVEGSYVLRHDFIDKKEVRYTWSQDYLD